LTANLILNAGCSKEACNDNQEIKGDGYFIEITEKYIYLNHLQTSGNLVRINRVNGSTTSIRKIGHENYHQGSSKPTLAYRFFTPTTTLYLNL